MRLTLERYFVVWAISSCMLLPQVSFAGDVAAVTTNGHCSFNRAEMLALDTNSFDQDFNGGWRSVANRDGCKGVAADLIRDYIEEHDIQSTIVLFHEAQMRAMAGQTEQALLLLPKTRKPAKSDRIGWNHYVNATIAFLKKDMDGLLESQARLANTPRPEGFNPVDVNGNPVELIWPPNLNVVDGFVECFEQDIEWAYSNCSRPLLKTATDK